MTTTCSLLLLWAVGCAGAFHGSVQTPALRHHGAVASPSIHQMPVQQQQQHSALALVQRPRQVGTVSMVINPGVSMALDSLGSFLKLSWRAAAVAIFYKVFLIVKKQLPAETRATLDAKLSAIRQAVRGVLEPKKVAAEKRAAAEAAEKRGMEARRAATIKESEEESLEEQADELKRAAEQLAWEEKEAERIEKEAAERIAKRDAMINERENAKAAKAEEEAKRKEMQQAQLQRLKDQANKAAKEEQERAAAEKAAAEKAEAERLAAIEAAKTPEERAAEAAAAAAEIAAKEAAEKRAAEEAAAALDAAADTAAASAASVAGALTPVGAGYLAPSGPASSASIASLLATAAGEVPGPRLLSLSNLHGDMRTPLLSAISELEAAYTLPDADGIRADLLGFWKLLVTSDDEHAAGGSTGFGSAGPRSILGHIAVFSEADQYEPKPTLQTIEVVADSKQGASGVGTLRGDFYIGTLASSGKLGVVEDYIFRELDDNRQGDGADHATRWSIAYLDSTMRIVRTEEGMLMVFGKMDGGAAQAEIEALKTAPVAIIEGGEEEEEEDDRPMWQRRLDDENANNDRFGPPGSDIP